MTQGLITIMFGDNVLMKIVVGCNGYKVKELAKLVKANWPVDVEGAYQLAEQVGFGCQSCRMIITASGIFGVSEESGKLENLEESEEFTGAKLYRDTFQQSKFNPRWAYGIADRLQIVKVDEKGNKWERHNAENGEHIL